MVSDAMLDDLRMRIATTFTEVLRAENHLDEDGQCEPDLKRIIRLKNEVILLQQRAMDRYEEMM